MSKEKEELVIKLLKENKTYKEISEIAHVSYSPISRINKKLNGDKSEPIRNQAYKMYLKGKKPVDVAVFLELDNVEASRYWEEYLQLEREYKFLEIKEKLQSNFFRFVELFELMQKKKYGIKEVEAAIQLALDTDVEGTFLEYQKDGVLKTQAQSDILYKQKEELKNELYSLKEQKKLLEGGKQVLLVEITSLINHKDFIKQVYYSPVNRIPMTRLGLSS